MSASPDKQWKPEEDALIRSLIKDGWQLKDMSQRLSNRSRRAIECRVSTLGLKSGNPRTKYSKNENFWETPNALNSYYAGLAAADMSLSAENRFTLAWQCHSDDERYMQRFINETNFTGKLFYTEEKSPTSENISIHCNLRIGACQKWNKDLENNFNIIPNKANRIRMPDLHSDFLKCCFLIGYTDGDGCIHAANNDMPQIRYVSASKDIIDWIRQFVDKNFNFSARRNLKMGKVTSSPNGSYHSCAIYGIQAIKLFEFLRQIDVPKFSRKWENPKFLNLVQSYKQKWPEFFVPSMCPVLDENNNIFLIKDPIVV